MLTKLSRRVLQTIAYTDQFEYPLTAFQVWQRLVAEKKTFSEVKKSLLELQTAGYLGVENENYFLKSSDYSLHIRSEKENQAQQLEKVAQQLVSVVQFIPWIKAVAITGSVAMNVAEEGDDIDVMIITKPNTLWLSRFILVLVSGHLGRRRFWWEDQEWLVKPKKSQQKEQTKWCLNLWLTEDSLRVPDKQHSLYTAYEVCQSRFIYDTDNVEEAFLTANAWVSVYLPHFYYWKKKQLNRQLKTSSLSFLWLLNLVVYALDVVLFISQRVYMANHMTTEKVSRSFAYFHPRPTTSLIRSGWKNSLKKCITTNKHTTHRSKAVANRSERKALSTFSLSEDIEKLLASARKRQQKVVLVTGVFDMLHLAHRQFLVQARMTGDFLIVGLESDKRVRELKGEGRPINNQAKRLKQMENLGVADAVFVLPEEFSETEDHLAVVNAIKPDILAVSSHSPYIEKKKKIMEKVGAQLKIVMDEDRAVSTTKLLKQLGKE